jgi:hypothetical protein
MIRVEGGCRPSETRWIILSTWSDPSPELTVEKRPKQHAYGGDVILRQPEGQLRLPGASQASGRCCTTPRPTTSELCRRAGARRRSIKRRGELISNARAQLCFLYGAHNFIGVPTTYLARSHGGPRHASVPRTKVGANCSRQVRCRGSDH